MVGRYALVVTIPSGNQVLGTKTPVWKLEDVKGMKLRTYGGEFQTKFYQAMGATGVQIPYMDYPDAIQKGVVVGNIMPIQLFNELQVTMQTPYYLTNGKDSKCFISYWMGAGYIHGMSNTLWKSLSDAEKRVVLQATRAAEESMYAKWAALEDQELQKALNMGAKYTYLSKEDIDKIHSNPIISNQWDDLAKAIDKAGGPGTAMIKRFFELAEKSPAQIQAIYDKLWEQRLAELW